MANRTDIVIYNGRLLPDDTPVDFVLWARDRDFEIFDSEIEEKTSRTGEGDVSGWFFVPDPA